MNYNDMRMHDIELRAESYDRKLEHWVSSRALMIVLSTTFVGLLLGNMFIGFVVGIVYVSWWLVSRLTEDDDQGAI